MKNKTNFKYKNLNPILLKGDGSEIELFYFNIWLKLLLILITPLLFTSCLKEDILTVKSEFTFTETPLLDGKKLSFTNLSVNGDTYKWTFQNGLPATSDRFNPGDVIFRTAGLQTISLEVKNRDGSVDVFEKQVQITLVPETNFSAEVLINDFAPAEVKITNLSSNVTTYQWFFPGATPASFDGATPPNIIYNSPGIKNIKLITNAGEKNIDIEVKPALLVDFNYTVKAIDSNLNAPVKLFLNNQTISALTYNWEITGPANFNFTTTNSIVLLPLAGNYQIKLTASNVKQTLSLIKNITILNYTNLAIQNNIEFGINSAQNTIGVSYSTLNKKLYKTSEINDTNGADIDIVFYGINSNFSFCAFTSPNNTTGFGIATIPNATTTIYNNKQEENLVTVPIVSTSEFDGLTNETSLLNLAIPNNINLFNGNTIPRIVPFKTQDGRKGLIKIKSIINDGANSRIVTDIKIQKH